MEKPTEFSLAQMRKEVYDEIFIRTGYYPRRVQQMKMTSVKADWKIGCMERVKRLLDLLDDNSEFIVNAIENGKPVTFNASREDIEELKAILQFDPQAAQREMKL